MAVPVAAKEPIVSDAVTDSIVVDAPLGVVFDVIADFEAYPEWQGDIKEAEVLDTDEDGWGTRVRFVVDAKVLRMGLVLAYTYTETSMHWELVSSDALKEDTGAYRLTDLGDGRTQVDYELELVLAIPVPGPIRRKAARHIVDAALRQMKERAEAVA